jgi:glycosyltransferase involved in cell wall biosynthesis
LLGESLRRAAAIVAPSRAAADLMWEVFPDLNIRVIPHGIRALQADERKHAPKVRFGMIGNVTLVKGIEIILEAWPLVQSEAAELHIFGAASDRRYIERCAQLGIHYHGPYREENLPEILAQIDVGVLPSQQPETFCYALSEFFAGGVPVVGSNYGALSERIVNYVNGIKVPRNDIQAWADAISLVIRDGALRERIIQGVQPPDSIDRMANEYHALYREVLRKGKRTDTADLRIPIQPATAELADSSRS